MDFQNIIQRAVEIRSSFSNFEQARYGREWTREEIALGLMGDIGDLAKLIQANEGVRIIPEAKEKLAHELADCLWSVIILADRYGIDLENAFLHTMNELEEYLKIHTPEGKR